MSIKAKKHNKIDLSQYYRFFNRPVTLNQAQYYSWSCSSDLERILGKGLWHQLYIFKGDNADGYFLKQEWDKFNDYVYNVCLQDKKFLQESNDQVEKEAKEIESFFADFKKIDFSKLSRQELYEKFKESDIVLKTKVASLWVGFLLEDVVEKKMLEIFKKYELPTEEAFSIITSVSRLNELSQEKIELLQIAAEDGDIEESLARHHKKYQYLPCYSVNVTPCDIEYFRERIQGLDKNKAKEKIAEIKNGFIAAKAGLDEFIKSTQFEPLDNIFIHYLHGFHFLKDYRSHFRSFMMFYMRQMVLEIGRRYEIDPTSISLLLGEEILELLSHDKTSDNIQKILESRAGGDSLYIFENEKDRVILRKDVSFNDVVDRQTHFKGTIANRGVARGEVKIIMNPNSINKVNEGAVLVSSMTRPDFLPAIKKAAALITNEGGMLCHAAIVSRELRKPCIIGTKIATDVLRDGDLVEVNADEGLVKIIKRKN